jgi:hypothetical protein
MRVRKLHEVASSGLDDFLANLGGHHTGIRIPSASVGALTHKPIDYVALLHCVDLIPGDALVGLGQLLTIAAPQVVPGEGSPASPVYPFERAIESVLWHFPDTYSRWFLTEDKTPPSGLPTGPADSDSFRFEDADTPALVYETVHFPAVPLAPGYLGLDDYTPPGIHGSVVLEARDLRWPWTDLQSFPSLCRPVDSNTRFRFYLRVRQTNPGSRLKLPIDPTAWAKFPGVFAPEDGYLVASQGAPGGVLVADTLQYWRCAGRILYQSGKHLRHFEPGEAAVHAPDP